MKQKTLKNILNLTAIIAATGMSVYTFMKTYKSIKSLENIDIDISDDIMLSSFFKKD